MAKAVLIGAVPPLMLQTAATPGGLPMEVFDGICADVLADRSQFFKDLTAPLYGANRRGATLKIYSGAPHGLCSTHKDRATRICSRSSRRERSSVGRVRLDC